MENDKPPLTSLVILPETSNSSPEDIFSSSLNLISPDGSQNSHGDPGASIIYKSKKFGDIQLSLANPEKQKDRFLMAHYLWNASLELAEFISGFGIHSTLAAEVDWAVDGKKVIELGAGRSASWGRVIQVVTLMVFLGTGLAGIIAALAGAMEVVVTDYPSTQLVSNIKKNVARNVTGNASRRIRTEGHEWGALSTQFSRDHANSFDIVLAADCFWMPGEHQNLLTSMRHFLSASTKARIWAVAGFHTGRAILTQFLDQAKETGLLVETIWERDTFGNERVFVNSEYERPENATERSKWLTIAVLKKKKMQGDEI